VLRSGRSDYSTSTRAGPSGTSAGSFERVPPPTPREKPRYQRQGAASQRGEESFSSSDDSRDSSSSSYRRRSRRDGSPPDRRRRRRRRSSSDGSSSTDGGPKHKTRHRRRRHSTSNRGPIVKLGKYNGSTCLDTFLARFHKCAEYYKWSENDKLFHLSGSLEAPADSVLNDPYARSNVAEMIRLLQLRFGVKDQDAIYRARLQSRRRKKGESLQELYLDICKLLSYAYPCPEDAQFLRVAGVDAFLTALDND